MESYLPPYDPHSFSPQPFWWELNLSPIIFPLPIATLAPSAAGFFFKANVCGRPIRGRASCFRTNPIQWDTLAYPASRATHSSIPHHNPSGFLLSSHSFSLSSPFPSPHFSPCTYVCMYVLRRAGSTPWHPPSVILDTYLCRTIPEAEDFVSRKCRNG